MFRLIGSPILCIQIIELVRFRIITCFLLICFPRVQNLSNLECGTLPTYIYVASVVLPFFRTVDNSILSVELCLKMPLSFLVL